MKVLFLDVDGVLNSKEWFEAADRTTESDYLGLRSVNPAAVARIQRVCAATGAVIVLSSTWRIIDDYVQTLRDFGLVLFDKTPQLAGSNRAEEILAWLEKRVEAVQRIAIIDDDADAGDYGLRTRLVRTSWEKGMQEEHEHALIALLS